ncbi:MAG: signal peptidase II [Planctomycetaceae bacterium]|nr:signal peptidase II [Planctomycetaceae bacterium]
MKPTVPRNRIPTYAAITVVALATDLGSKEWAFQTLGLHGRSRTLIDTWVRFELLTNLNYGALWGVGQGMAPLFAVLSIAAFFGVIYWLFFCNAASSLWTTVALALVSGGTLGNLYDRLGLHGIRPPDATSSALAVRDFLHFQFGNYDYPIFNIADSCLVVGAIMLLLQSFKTLPQEVLSEAMTSD